MATTSNVTIQINETGTISVSTGIRPCGDSFIACHTYPDSAPILVLDDGPAHVAVTVRDREHVSADDLDTARRLADVADRYVTELEIRLSKQGAARGHAA